MTPESASKTLAAYIRAMWAHCGSHVFLRPGTLPGMMVEGDMRALPGAMLSAEYIADLAHSAMPLKRAQQFAAEGRTQFVVHAVELKRRFLINVRRRRDGVEMKISSADKQPPAFEHAPFDPARTPPTLSVEAEPEPEAD